jgi:hypothetical protein
MCPTATAKFGASLNILTDDGTVVENIDGQTPAMRTLFGMTPHEAQTNPAELSRKYEMIMFAEVEDATGADKFMFELCPDGSGGIRCPKLKKLP